MSKIKAFFFMLIVISFLPVFASAKDTNQISNNIPETKQQHDERMDWWRNDRFGMFIHWGLYAIPAGEWNGNTSYAEWIRTRAQIPINEYDKFINQFNPVKFDADQWVKLAKQAGMKYIVITSKHHDGFCLWDSKVTDYDIMSTPYQQDILAKLTKACNKYDIKMCFYHSIMDWHHPDYLPRRKWEANHRSADGAEFPRYVKYMKTQLAELVHNYHPHVLWFDGEWESTWTHKDGIDLYNYVRQLDPDIIVNNRVDKGRQGMQGLTKDGDFRGDFGTPEQEIPEQGLPGVDWESCMTMNGHWGWNKNDKNWKSGQDLIRKLIDIASKGGNFLLNIGPKADGTFPDESIERLKQIGQWMQINSESIYETTANPFEKLIWGRCTKKVTPSGTILYLHVFDWPKNGKLFVPGLKNKVKNTYLLANKKTLKTTAVTDGIEINIPSKALDPVATVIVMEIIGDLDIVAVPIRQNSEGALTVFAVQATIHDSKNDHTPKIETRYEKPNIGFWTDEQDWVSWKFEIDHPGEFDIYAELASYGNGQFEIKLDNKTISAKGKNTGGYDKYAKVPLGKINITNSGPKKLELKPVPGKWQPMNLCTLTLQPVH